MKTNDLLNQLADDISDSYDVIEAGGGAMPSDRITWNLANAIRSVPGPTPPVPPVGDNPYGKVGYYPWTSTRDISGDMVEIGDVDNDKLDEFLATYPSMDGMSEFMYQQDWESEDPESNYVWWWYWQEGELKIQPEDFASTTGIQATVEEGTDWAYIRVEITYQVDTEADLLYAEFSSEQNLQNAGWSQDDVGAGYVITVGNAQVYILAIKSYEFGSVATDFPNYFLSGARNMDIVDTSHLTITSVGSHFLYFCELFNAPLNLSRCTTIGDMFLYYCISFNQPLDLSSCTTIGGSFLGSCNSFNQPLDLSHCTTIDGGFLSGCVSFNSALTLGSSITTIPGSFMYGCTVFNQPLDVSRITSIGIQFLYDCRAFNQPLPLNSLAKLGSYFLTNCLSFNQPITIPASATEMIKLWDSQLHFMEGCRNMTSTITWNSTALPLETSDKDRSSLAIYSRSTPSYPIYQTGVTVTGSGATRLKQIWPNENNASGYWRKLL